MTGPAPEPGEQPLFGAPAAASRVSPVTGRFANPRLEAAFRRHAWPEWSSRVRIVCLLAAGLILTFGYTDYLALGPGPPLYLCWGLRLVVLAAAIGVARLTRGARRVRRLDRAVFGFLLLLSATVLVVTGLQLLGIQLEAPGMILMILGFYLFVPARFEIQLASATFASAGFLIIATNVLQPTTIEVATVALEVLFCNVLGGFTALRTQVLQRREYVVLRQVQRRSRFEEMMARLSTRFITLPAEAVDQAIDTALAEIGDFTEVDRTYVFEFDTEQKVLSCSHEWCRAGVPSALRQLQQVPYDAYSWAMTELLAGRPVAASSLAELPPEAAAERAEARRQGAKSLLVLPLIYGRQVLGAIGFHAVREEMQLDEERVASLRMVGEMILGVLIHRRTSAELARQRRSLEASVAALEKSNTELQQFAYVASHDLQEPLRSISSFSSLLAARCAGREDARAEEYVHYLKAAAARMHALITNLLDYSRLDASAKAFVTCDPAEIVDSAVQNLRASIDEIGATVTVAPLPPVQGDPSQLLQLFQNLIGNALKFQAGGAPEVTISAERCEGHWLFSVADNGIGIEPRHAQRIFQVFTRLHAQDQYPGTGIGLAVCRRIVDRHRGRIWVEPNRPHGSVFLFTLPLAA
jgi:signal transduction histidine kinase